MARGVIQFWIWYTGQFSISPAFTLAVTFCWVWHLYPTLCHKSKFVFFFLFFSWPPLAFSLSPSVIYANVLQNTFFTIREFSLLGLFIIALGTGGIKPCVSAFGGEQFVRPQQDKQLEQFFSVFYFAINAGSLISTFVTPILREDVHCFGSNSCFPLAFGVPALLMIVAVGKCAVVSCFNGELFCLFFSSFLRNI